ncbi:MAG TPA: flavin reductase family protein, partial [Trebonia sp.]|nr:flavin reductase family protein [Trebonia sp.]
MTRHGLTAPAPPDTAPSGTAPSGTAPPDRIDPDAFRRALSRHPAGVAIITLRGPAGLTVTSFSSASLNPP